MGLSQLEDLFRSIPSLAGANPVPWLSSPIRPFDHAEVRELERYGELAFSSVHETDPMMRGEPVRARHFTQREGVDEAGLFNR